MEEFKVYLLNNDRKIRTVYRHLKNLERVLAYCPNFSKEEIETYFTNLKEQGCKNTYLNSLTSTIRQYGHFKNDQDLKIWKFRKKEQFSKATMSDEEIELFLNLQFQKSTKPYYDRRTNAYHEPFYLRDGGFGMHFFQLWLFLVCAREKLLHCGLEILILGGRYL